MANKVYETNIHDSKGAKTAIENLTYKFPRLSKILADGSYQGDLNAWVKKKFGWELSLIQIVFNRFFSHFKTDP